MEQRDTERRARLLAELFEQAPMKGTFGMALSFDVEGNARFEMPHRPQFCHALKDTHGGVIATLIDNAGWFTAATRYDHWVNTAEMTVRLLEPANREDLAATGRGSKCANVSYPSTPNHGQPGALSSIVMLPPMFSSPIWS